MTVGASSRVIMLGIDGLPPWQLDQFLDAKYLPNFERLLRRGTRCDAIPTLPALTAPGWAAIASGRSPSALGIENILLPTPGHTPDEIRADVFRSFEEKIDALKP
jgi:predicted AlkP superfamily phosphohydrolase/phosphomutase